VRRSVRRSNLGSDYPLYGCQCEELEQVSTWPSAGERPGAIETLLGHVQRAMTRTHYASRSRWSSWPTPPEVPDHLDSLC